MNKKKIYLIIAILLVISVILGICAGKKKEKKIENTDISQDVSSGNTDTASDNDLTSGVTIPDMTGMRLDEASPIYNELGIITDVAYVDDENSQNTVLFQSTTYIENPAETHLEITVSKNKVEYGTTVPQIELPNIVGKPIEDGLMEITYLNLKYQLITVPLKTEQITEDTKLGVIVAEKVNEKCYISDSSVLDVLSDKDSPDYTELVVYGSPDGGNLIPMDEDDIVYLYIYIYDDEIEEEKAE